MEEGVIRYEDLISPDDSVKALIEQLTELNKTYGTMLETVKSGAKEIISQLKNVSAATAEGKAEIDESTAAANRLARAQKELRFAMSDTGKEVAWLKSQVASQNKLSVEQQRASAALVGSYNKIKAELKEYIALWKTLSAEERAGAFGTEVVENIEQIRAKIRILDEQLKGHVQSLTAVEKAEQKLAYLRSAEGQRLLELKRLIAEETAAHRTQGPAISEVAQAYEKLKAARSNSRQQVHQLNILTKEANRISKLQAQLNNSEAGSYNQLAAQYELNKIKLNAMSAAEREGTQAGKELEAETLALYVQMQKLQEATGNHRLSVGNYARSWDGLGIAVSQVVRELPAAAVSMNTFFLGISNNIPILMDEINKLRAENKKAIAEGKQTKSVIGSITAALFSWNTLLVVGLTALSMHGKEIINWIGKLMGSHPVLKTTSEALEDVNKELEKTNNSYGQNVATVKKLAKEWANLSSKKEQLQWIRDNKSEFDKLDISVRNVNDAENIFAKNTAVMIEALRLRAQAAAAMKLASEQYEIALKKQLEAEQEQYDFKRVVDKKTGQIRIERVRKPAPKTPGWEIAPRIGGSSINFATTTGKEEDLQRDYEKARQKRIKGLKEEETAAQNLGDAYMDIVGAREAEANARLKAAGIEQSHKYKKDSHSSRTPRQRDLTDQIWRNDLSIRKKYELSISALQRDEFQRRKIEAIDAANATIREMQEKFRKNEAYLKNADGRFKPLTSEQREQIENQQKEINAIIENTRRKLEIDLQKIEDEKNINSLQTLREIEERKVDVIADSIEKEKKLRLKQIEDEETMYITSARSSSGDEVVVTGSMTPEQRAAFKARKERTEAEYDIQIYNLRKGQLDDWISYVRKGSQEELNILLQKLEIERKIAIAENKLKSPNERREESAINRDFDVKKTETTGEWRMTNFDQWQAAAEAEFNIVRHNDREITKFRLEQEKARWKEMLRLAKSGAIKWSDAQIAEAQAMIKVLDREISENSDMLGLISDKGLGGGLLTMLGLNDKQIEALSAAANIVIEQIKAISDAEVKAAEEAVKAAEKRVEAAQKAYDAEIEGRNKGYANNVATAKKELQQERKNLAQRQKLLEEAKRRQEAVDTVMQASSLVTASANLWSVFSKTGPLGPALAIAAITAMWTSFAIAKVRAAQVTKASSQEYGEGGLEILEGGSHASGNDIDLQTKNSKGKNMKAEGGEALAIINKRNTRKYRKVLPRLVDSLNKGTFEDKFSGAFKTGDSLAQSISYQQDVDLSQLEENVKALRANSEQQYYTLPDGSYIEKKKNVTRHIH